MSTSPTEPRSERPAHRSAGQIVADIALFFAGPFITIACAATFPFTAARLLTRRGEEIWRRLRMPE